MPALAQAPRYRSACGLARGGSPPSAAYSPVFLLPATCRTRAFRTVPPQELTDAAHKAARLIDTDAHIQTASRSYTRALWYQSRVWDPDD